MRIRGDWRERNMQTEKDLWGLEREGREGSTNLQMDLFLRLNRPTTP
jgi:hypothetical protein